MPALDVCQVGVVIAVVVTPTARLSHSWHTTSAELPWRTSIPGVAETAVVPSDPQRHGYYLDIDDLPVALPMTCQCHGYEGEMQRSVHLYPHV